MTDGLEKVNETDSKSLGHMVGGAVIIFPSCDLSSYSKKSQQSPS